MQDDPRQYTARRPGRSFTLAGLAVVLMVFTITGALVGARELRVHRQTQQLEEGLAQGRRVLVKHVQQAPPRRSIEVPAGIHGFVETPIYAKIAGYLKTINVDKGDRVTTGEVLAVLESPEIDQQVANARANYELQAVTNRRNQYLVRKDLIAQQAADESRGAMLQAKATLDQLEAQQKYEVLRAPFAGIITARNVDPGALIPQVTAPSATGTPLLMLATLSPLRVYADVPQSVAVRIQTGDPASISVAEYPGREFKGSVTRRSDALRPSTRTMLVEVDVPNDDDALFPGMYATVRFSVALPAGPPQVPDDALIFRDGKVLVPLVHDNRLSLTEVQLGYDDGRLVEIASGVGSDDQVAVNVGQAVQDGELVQPIPADAD